MPTVDTKSVVAVRGTTAGDHHQYTLVAYGDIGSVTDVRDLYRRTVPGRRGIGRIGAIDIGNLTAAG